MLVMGLTALMAAVLENTTGSAALMDCTVLPLSHSAVPPLLAAAAGCAVVGWRRNQGRKSNVLAHQ